MLQFVFICGKNYKNIFAPLSIAGQSLDTKKRKHTSTQFCLIYRKYFYSASSGMSVFNLEYKKRRHHASILFHL